MNREVILRSDEGEMYLGTVGSLLGCNSLEDGRGMSLSAVIADIVSDIALNSEYDSRRFIIELRDPT